MPLGIAVFFFALMIASGAQAQKIDLLCTNNGGQGREDAVTFDPSAMTLTWAQSPNEPLRVKTVRKTRTGYILQMTRVRTTEMTVYINGKDSYLDIRDGKHGEKDPCHQFSVAKAAAAAPSNQYRVKQEAWTGVADDRLSRLLLSCGRGKLGFTFYLDGHHGPALNRVKDIKQGFVIEISRGPGDNRKFPLFLYMTPADDGFVQEEGWNFIDGEATAFLDAFGKDGRLSLLTGKGAEVASWTLKGTSPLSESTRKDCNL